MRHYRAYLRILQTRVGYTPGNAFANPFDNAVAQFMTDNPDIKVEITGYPPNDEGFTKLTAALQSGTAPRPPPRFSAAIEDSGRPAQWSFG